MNETDVKKKIKIILNYFNNERYVDAISRSKKILKSALQYEAFLLNIIGLSYQRLKNNELAKSYFLKIIDKYPGHLQSKLNYTIILKSEKKIVEAEQLLQKIIEQEPKYIQAINNLANLKKDKGDFEGASELYKKALGINSDVPIIHFNLALCFANLRKKEEALLHANKALILNPALTNADKLISDLTNYKTDKKNHVENMEKKLNSNILSEKQKIILLYSLGKAYEDKGIYEKSFNFYKNANLKARLDMNYNFNDEINFFQLIKNIFNEKKNYQSLATTDSNLKKKIIFICGMPRSGTTLLEQIVSSHKDVTALGETDYLSQIIEKKFQNKLNLDETIEKLFKNKKKITDEYLSLLSDVENKYNVFSDKSLLNFKFIGFIHIFFQEAKIIVLKRKYEDNLLSIYKNYLPNRQLSWSFSEDEIYKYYQLFNEYLKFWKLIMPNSFVEVNYEDIINNNYEITKSILEYCQLSWDDNCLKYYKENKSPIKTASFNQASKPIYKSSINSFKNFSKYFKKNP